MRGIINYERWILDSFSSFASENTFEIVKENLKKGKKKIIYV